MILIRLIFMIVISIGVFMFFLLLIIGEIKMRYNERLLVILNNNKKEVKNE